MTSSFWIFTSFCAFIGLAFKPAKRALIERLDGKVSVIRRDVEESCNIRLIAEQELAAAQEELRFFEKKRAQTLALANQHVQFLYKEYNDRVESIAERRAVMLRQSIEHQRWQVAVKLKSEILKKCIEAAREDLQRGELLVDNEALFMNNKAMVMKLMV